MRQNKLFLIFVVIVGLLAFTGDLAAKVIRVYATVNPTSFNGNCPKVFTFTGKITSDSPGEVKYKWLRSDNANAPVQTISFNGPGTQVVTTTWTLGAAGMTYNGWEAVQILAPNAMTSNKAAFTLQCGGGKITAMRPVQTLKPVQIRPGLIGKACPDPAAYEIQFQIVRRDPSSRFKGRVRITGIVKNIGSKTFIAGRNQAKAYLYEMPPGSSSGAIKAQREILNLAPGATMELTYERDWNSSSPSEGEFPPSYRLQILLDPDIYMDASKDNDDCTQNNNKKDRSGADINGMLR